MTQGVVQHSTSSTVSVKIPWFDLCSSSLCGLVSSLLLQCWIAQIYQIWFDLPSHFSLTWLLMVVIRGGQRNAKAPPPAWEKELDMSPNSRQLGPPDTADIDTALHIPRSLLKEFSTKFQDFLPAHQEGRVFVYDVWKAAFLFIFHDLPVYLPVYLAWFDSECCSRLDAQICDECPHSVCWFADCTLHTCVIPRKAREQNYAMDAAKTWWEQIKVRVVWATSVSTVSTCKAWAS